MNLHNASWRERPDDPPRAPTDPLVRTMIDESYRDYEHADALRQAANRSLRRLDWGIFWELSL